MIRSFLFCQNFETKIQTKAGAVQSYTTAYQLVPKSMDSAKGYGNEVAKHNRQISTRIV